MNYIANKYNRLCSTSSDINEHLPTLFKYAQECNSVFETGVRGVVSSWALLYGLVSKKSDERKTMQMNDIEACNIDEILTASAGLDINMTFKWQNNLLIEFNAGETYDLTFIDTYHIYPQLLRELNKFSQVTNKYIIMHDTTIDANEGEFIRGHGYNREKLKEYSQTLGYPAQDIVRGLWPAIEEFLKNNQNWKLKERFTNNNGLTVLERLY
jgi:hypothetical protein